MNKEYIAPWVRVSILIVSMVVIFILSRIFTGYFIPKDARDTLIFQDASYL